PQHTISGAPQLLSLGIGARALASRAPRLRRRAATRRRSCTPTTAVAVPREPPAHTAGAEAVVLLEPGAEIQQLVESNVTKAEGTSTTSTRAAASKASDSAGAL